MINHLQGSQDSVLTSAADDLFLIKWHVDGSHLAHPNMKGHTGASLTFGTSMMCGKSTKQKLNTRSSAETELVSVDGPKHFGPICL